MSYLESKQMQTNELLAERGKTHGKFSEHADITQSLKRIFNYWTHARDDLLTDSQREALDMIAHKIGRILAGDPNYQDHWDDIAGYAKLVSNEIAELMHSALKEKAT
jgi:hypothetical protein